MTTVVTITEKQKDLIMALLNREIQNIRSQLMLEHDLTSLANQIKNSQPTTIQSTTTD